MNRQTINYLIIFLALGAALLATGCASLRTSPLESPSPSGVNALPTILAVAATPTLRSSATPVASPTPSPTATPVIQLAEPTATAVATPSFLTHTVQPGETLIAIAERYNLSSDEIASANNLTDPNAIYPDQTLRIPTDLPPNPPTNQLPVSPTPQPIVSPPNWPPSRVNDGVAQNYPLSRVAPSGQITIHYQPETYPYWQIEPLTQAVDDIWAEIQTELGKPFSRPIDVYLAGTLFAINPGLRGLAKSWDYRAFVMIDGAIHPGEDLYIIAHELTHIASNHLLGPASSIMIHEGLAVHLPQAYLTEQAGYLPHTEICAALLNTPEFRTAVQLHTYSYSPSGFSGQVRNFTNYNLSGCFVTYLLESYGLEKFDRLYNSGDFVGVYGRSLADLDVAWQNWLTAVSLTVDPQQLRTSIANVTTAYLAYLDASAGGVHANWDAYLHLNRARLAANQGQFAQAELELAAFHALFAPEQ